MTVDPKANTGPIWTGQDYNGVEQALVVFIDRDDGDEVYETIFTPVRKAAETLSNLQKQGNRAIIYPEKGMPDHPKINQVAAGAICGFVSSLGTPESCRSSNSSGFSKTE